MPNWNIDTPDPEYVQGLGPPPPPNTRTPEVGSLIRELKDQQYISLDTETTGLSNYKDYPLYWSIAWGNRRIALHASTLPQFKEIFNDPLKRWIFANAKFDMHMLANYGTPLAGEAHCVQVMDSLIREEEPHDLKYMANIHLGHRWKSFQDTFGKISVKKGVSAEDVIRKAEATDMGQLIEYASMDAWGTWELYWIFKKQLEAEPVYSLYCNTPPYLRTLFDIFIKVEMPYTRVLWEMERKGVLIDMEKVNALSPKLLSDEEELSRQIVKESIKQLKDALRNLTSEQLAELPERTVQLLNGLVRLNPKSTDQLRHYFFDQPEEGGLGLVPINKTKGGKKGIRVASVDQDTLEKLAEVNDVAQLILDFRSIDKLHSTYVSNMQYYADAQGRIHTTFHQDIARTGRLTSRDPNLQNIPNPENDKWLIRSVFIAPKDYTLLVFDYKQLEMRLLACAANDVAMQSVFLRNWDIHMGNVSLMWGIPYDDIVDAKKMDKMIKDGKAPKSALTEYMAQCLAYRRQVKEIGFGQPDSQAEVKPAQNGETYRLNAHGNPVLPNLMGSVSTWEVTLPQQKGLAQGSHSPCFC
jgi:DNA polymerase-1